MKKHLIIPVALATVATGAVAAYAAAAGTTVQVREADFIDGLSDTRATGHYEFLREGIHVWTEGSTSTDKVAEYFPASGALPTAAGLEWFGTTPAPGAQIVFDADGVTGNNNDYNILVGETVYGGDWWLTNASSADAKAADPSGTCDPVDTCANDQGNGSRWFGTLEEWKTALPNARVLAGGFSLGSGVKGDGVVRAVTLGDTTYEFTDEAVTPTPETPDVVDVTGDVTAKPIGKKKVKVVLRSDATPAGDTEGAPLEWTIEVDGSEVASLQQGAGEKDTLFYKFGKNTGKHKVVVFKDGVKVSTTKVDTGA